MEERHRGARRADLWALATSFLVGGVSTTLVATGNGTSDAVAVLAAVIMYSATGELAYIAVVSAGGSAVTGAISALLVSARFGILSMSLSGRLRSTTSRWEQAAAAFLVVDPSVALALRDTDDVVARRTYWVVSWWMAGGWLVGSVLGVLAGALISDPRALGLDAVIPATLIALLVPASRRRPGALAVVGAAVVTLVLTPVLPAGLPVLAALAVLPVATLLARRSAS